MYRNMRYRKKETKVVPVDDNACVICFREVNIYSVGQCDHPVCFECSTRMRVLCRRNECPICRQDLPKVIFSREINKYDDIKDKVLPMDAKYNIAFATEDVEIVFKDLLVHICPDCKKIFDTFKCLWEHVRRVHNLSYCDLCVDNLNILTKERRCYTKKGLSEHKAEGDKDDKSHKGHPMCEFCHTRYMDNDALYRHVRRDHLFCHFCDADGIHQSHDSLRKHFREEHFVCEEGECYMESFTSVFRTEIDLKAHKAATHGKNMTRAGLRQARTLDIEFQLAPRPRLPNNRRQNRMEENDLFREEVDERQIERNNGAVGVDYQQAFPSLGGQDSAEVPTTSKLQTRHFQITSRLHSGSVPEPTNENYPALPNAEASVKVHLNADQFKNLSIKVKTTVTTEKIDRSNQEQYPPLSGTSSNQPTVTQWTAKDIKTDTKKKINKTNYNPPKKEDFPALVSKTATKKVSNFSQTVEPEPEPEPLFVVKKKKKKSKAKNIDPGPSLQGNEKKPQVKTKQETKNITKVPPVSAVKEKTTTNNKVLQDKREELVESKTNKINTSEKIPPTKPAEKEIKKLKDDDFPALVSGTSTKTAPPGFEWKVKRPPPGLKIPENAPTVAPPTTFSAMDDSLFPSLIGPVEKLGEYLEPSNFARRNEILLGKAAKAFDGDKWEEFKDMSGLFRSSVLSGEEYYDYCKSAMSEETFLNIFPELLALLPDISLQLSLWKSYEGEKNERKNPLLKCVFCSQIVESSDMKEHNFRHNLQNTAFPSPTKQKNLPKAWARK